MRDARGNKYDLGLLAAKLEAVRTPRGDGRVAFKGLISSEIRIVLDSAICLSSEIPMGERRRILAKGCSESGRKGKITRWSLEREIRKLESEYLKRPKRPFVLVTSLSMSPQSGKMPSVRLKNCTLTFSRDLPRKFDQSAFSGFFQRYKHSPFREGFTRVRIRTKARSESDAVELSLDALDTLRGIWNFSLNQREGFRWSAGPVNPVNKILLGTVHTLHKIDGKPCSTMGYWYESVTPAETNPARLDRHWNRVKDEEQWIRRRVQASGYANDLSVAFSRYARALDGCDLKGVFLKLWNVLEYLTAVRNADYSRVIRRCLFLCVDREFHRQVLEHLRDKRNATVHDSSDAEGFEDLVYLLKRYVEELFIFHLDSVGEYATLAEAAEFLDLPCDKAVLKKKIQVYKRALEVRTRGHK